VTVPVEVSITVPSGTESASTEDGVNPLGGDSPEDKLMPDVVCMNLQEAQDEIQDHGVFFSRSEDASGDDRRQIVDRNWVVVSQFPAAGSPIGERDAILSVLKHDETSDC
jgi:beta-lactam-binding protein with PASTA domain